ncbi:MAG: SDR family NAD(P)-dependent oxidoreductase [Pseudomonadota bacterium]
MKDVAGKIAFVTGGASGLGLAMARAFSAAGMNVALADIEAGALERAAADLESGGGRVLALPLDVTDRAAMERAADATEEAFGKVHVVCNNAGVAVGGPVDRMSYADWDWVLGVNVNGVINGVQTFTPRMAAHGDGGHFVNTASMAGHIATPGLSVYSTSKFAVVGLSEAMRRDLAPQGIGVSVLCPGVVRTNIFDSGRNRPPHLAAAENTAGAVLLDDVPEAEREAGLQALLDGALDPALVGDMVLHAIRHDELYIFSHPEMREYVERRSQEILGAMDRWAAYRNGHQPEAGS